MHAKKAVDEIERFPGGRKAGPGWVTPRMREQREQETMERVRAERAARRAQERAEALALARAARPRGRPGRPSNAEAAMRAKAQYGTVSVSNLPVVSVDGVPSDAPEPRVAAAPVPPPERAETAQETDIFAKIERLADLQQKGILSPEEFATKKAELLSRL